MSALCIAFLSEIFTDVLAHWVVITAETHILRQTEDKVDRRHVVHAFLFTCVYTDSLSDKAMGLCKLHFQILRERECVCVCVCPSIAVLLDRSWGVSPEAESWLAVDP